eukprot:2806992-Rhodomonas_salina.1
MQYKSFLFVLPEREKGGRTVTAAAGARRPERRHHAAVQTPLQHRPARREHSVNEIGPRPECRAWSMRTHGP